MSQVYKIWVGSGALIVGLSIILGAFAAHALKTRLDAYYCQVFEKAVYYQTMQGFGILVVGILAALGLLAAEKVNLIGGLFLVGAIIFSGSLYALVLTKQGWFGAITPIGGSLMIVGWLWLGILLLRK